MKRSIGVFLFVVGFFLQSGAQNQSSVIKVQAMDMAKALIKKDYSTFSKYMHPKLTQAAGGRTQLISKMDSANMMAAKFGAEIKKVIIGNPGSVIKYNKELQATLPQITEMKTGFGNLTLETTLVAISENGGENWYFVDTSVFNVKELKKSLPNLSPELVIPPAKSPKFTPTGN